MNRSTGRSTTRLAADQAPPSRGPAVRLGSLPLDSEQDRRLLQDRLALLNKISFAISGTFLVVTLSVDWIRGVGSRISSLGGASHLAGALLAFGIWQLCRRRRALPPRILPWLDVLGTVGTCAAFIAMGHHNRQPYAFYTALLACLHVNLTRAVIVPSGPSRTFVLALASFAGLILSRSVLPVPLDLPQTSAARMRLVLEALLWSGAATSVATVASRVIYGLHERALEARQLGQYALEEKIGEGGMGEIYRARHAMLRRPTAVKLLAGGGSEHELRRFEKEVQLTARLSHPNTISIYDYGRTPDGVFYYAMELLEGMSLEQLVAQHGPLPPARVIHILLQVCGALTEAHGVGLIHRDIKPANIYLCRRGGVPDFVKVLDFGLVRELRSDAGVSRSNVDLIVGTPLYMSPEAIVSPGNLDARADLYGLGAVAYFLLTGAPPFDGANVLEICSHHLHTTPEPPAARRPVADDLQGLILACLAKDPAQRPESAQRLSQALAACRDAGGWGPEQAEPWWARVEDGRTGSEPAAAKGDEASRRTLCCADLAQRLAETQPAGVRHLPRS